MTTTTRADIRRRAAGLVRKRSRVTTDGVTVLTSDASTDLRSVTDTTAGAGPPVPTSLNRYRNWHIYRPAAVAAGDQVRAVAEYDARNREYRINGEPYTNAANTERFELLKDHPDNWNAGVNFAMEEFLFFPRFDEFSPVSESRRIYQVSAAPISISDLERPLSQIHNIQWHDESETTNEESWKDWDNGGRTWELFEDEGSFFIDFGFSTPDSSMQMRLVSLVPYSALTDETSTSAVEEEWAAFATLMVMGDWFRDENNPDDEWNVIYRKFEPAYWSRRRTILGRYTARSVGRNPQFVGAVGVAGRFGRGTVGSIGRYGRGL